MKAHLALVFTLTATASNAEYTGRDLKAQCDPEAALATQFECTQFLFGLSFGATVAGAYAAQHYNPQGSFEQDLEEGGAAIGICLPGEATFDQLLLVVSKFLDDHPERLHEGAGWLGFDALRDAFPCK